MIVSEFQRMLARGSDAVAPASWRAPALWRFVRVKSGRGLPQSKTWRN